MKSRHREILGIIKTIRESFIGAEYVYTNGSCFQFYRILKKLYPETCAYYDGDHVISMIGNRMYDITGEVKNTEGFIPFYMHHTEEQFKGVKFKITNKYETKISKNNYNNKYYI